MINVILPIIDRAEEYSKSIASIAIRPDVQIFVGAVQELESKLNLPSSVVMNVYKTGSKKEEIINSLKSYLSEGKVVVARRPFTKKEFDSIVSGKAEVTYFESKPKNKFVGAFRKFVGGMIKAMFGIKFFDGDISLICFNEDMSEVLQNVNSLSYSTRVDRWRGVEYEAVSPELPPVKIEANKSKNVQMLIFALLCLIVPVVVTVVVALFANVTFLIGMVLFCLDVLGLAGMVLLLCVLYFNLHVGQRYFKDAVES